MPNLPGSRAAFSHHAKNHTHDRHDRHHQHCTKISPIITQQIPDIISPPTIPCCVRLYFSCTGICHGTLWQIQITIEWCNQLGVIMMKVKIDHDQITTSSLHLKKSLQACSAVFLHPRLTILYVSWLICSCLEKKITCIFCLEVISYLFLCVYF